MQDYEILSENCKIRFIEGFELKDQKYTQVSVYVFNENYQLLIVKNGDKWVIPGGHPERDESPEQTLAREVMEEACMTIKEATYIGAVEVVENGETYYQLRYTARPDKILDFKPEFETSERMFVYLRDLHDYIPYCYGEAFSAQIIASKEAWGL